MSIIIGLMLVFAPSMLHAETNCTHLENSLTVQAVEMECCVLCDESCHGANNACSILCAEEGCRERSAHMDSFEICPECGKLLPTFVPISRPDSPEENTELPGLEIPKGFTQESDALTPQAPINPGLK
jgi:hypothetical protein